MSDGEPSDELGIPGVRGLDHTADVGFEVVAPDLETLLRRSGSGLVALLLGDDRPEAEASVEVEVDAESAAGLLRGWLRELLYRHEAEGLTYVDADFRELGETGLRARVRVGPAPGVPAREIKGVTWHGLRAEEDADGRWRATVIFDV